LKIAFEFHSNLLGEYAVCGGGQLKERNFNIQALGRFGQRRKIKIWLCLTPLTPPLKKQIWKKEKSTGLLMVPVS
jgi:hypothetical protein